LLISSKSRNPDRELPGKKSKPAFELLNIATLTIPRSKSESQASNHGHVERDVVIGDLLGVCSPTNMCYA